MQWIDTYCDDWLDTLDTLASRHADCFAHLLLDGAFAPGLHGRLRGVEAAPHECHALFAGLPGPRPAAIDVSPVVVAFRRDSQRLRAVLREANGRPMVTLIATPESADALARRLAAWCIVDAAGTWFNFRFPDTRRLPTVAAVLDDAQRASMIGPTRAWHCIDRTGHWIELPLPNPQLQLSAEPRLTAEQFSALVADSEPDEVLSVLEPDFSDDVLQMLPSRRFAAAARALRLADRCHITAVPDRIACVGVALTEEDDGALAARIGEIARDPSSNRRPDTPTDRGAPR